MSTPRAASRVLRGLLLAFALGCALLVSAQLAVPPLTGHVTDLTGTLSAEQKGALERTLSAFEARKGSQLAVLLMASTAPEAIDAYALRVAEQWKLGRKKIDDGAILLVAKEDRALRIEVGYGLEGALNDATSQRIISEIIVPRFKQQDFYGGLTAGVGQIIRVIDGEPLPAVGQRPLDRFAAMQQYAPTLLILALVVGGVLRAVLGRVAGALVTGGAVAVIAWWMVGAVAIAVLAGIMALFVTLLGGSLGRHGLGGHYGGGDRGGSGLGGFRGGGGGFGGGGASGRW